MRQTDGVQQLRKQESVEHQRTSNKIHEMSD